MHHSSILSKLSSLPIQDHVYNWFVNYMKDHTHTTKYQSFTSQPASINASVFQGSAIGPAMYVVNSMDLIPLHSSCSVDKYPDDRYLIIPAGSDDHLQSEIDSIETWAVANNLRLNKSKSVEMIVFSCCKAIKARSKGPVIAPLSLE